MDELQSHLRREPPPGDDVVVVRGGEDNAEKVRRHAERIHRAYVLEGTPLYGLSVYCNLDELAGRRLAHQLASYRLVRLSTVGRLRTAGFPFCRPSLDRTSRSSCPAWCPPISTGCLPASIRLRTIQDMDASTADERRGKAVVTVDIAADLNDEDETGYVWTFLDEAREPSLIRPGALVLAGDDDAPAVAEVVDLVPKAAGTVVHLHILPGLFDDYEALVRRAGRL